LLRGQVFHLDMRNFGLGALLLVAGCVSAPPPPPAPTATPLASPTPQKSANSDFITETGKAVFRTHKGRPWLMEAFKVKYMEGQREARLQDVDWTLTDSKGKEMIRIKSKGAVYKMESERVEFDGTVEARREVSKDLLRCNRMVWDGKTGILKGMDGVRWTRGSTTVQGDTATTNDKLERIVVEGNVKVTTVLEDEPFDSGG
jgi:LPS export ABC transporter protein LptC